MADGTQRSSQLRSGVRSSAFRSNYAGYSGEYQSLADTVNLGGELRIPRSHSPLKCKLLASRNAKRKRVREVRKIGRDIRDLPDATRAGDPAFLRNFQKLQACDQSSAEGERHRNVQREVTRKHRQLFNPCKRLGHAKGAEIGAECVVLAKGCAWLRKIELGTALPGVVPCRAELVGEKRRKDACIHGSLLSPCTILSAGNPKSYDSREGCRRGANPSADVAPFFVTTPPNVRRVDQEGDDEGTNAGANNGGPARQFSEHGVWLHA